MVVAAFVAPYLLEATTRFVASAAMLPGVRLGLITTVPASELPPVLREHLDGHWRVDDGLDPQQIADAVRGLSGQLGPVERLVGALEQLQVPLAQVRGALGIPGMDEQTAHNVRDKARMKSVLRAADVPCARHQLVVEPGQALGFADSVGFPLVAKPPAGSGAQATYRLDDAQALRSWVQAITPSAEDPALLEEFLLGDEHTFDSVTIGGETVWASISDYFPTPLEVLRNPWIQWVVVLPRDISGPQYDGIRQAGPAALRALGVQDAFSHMEWFRRTDGSVAISEVGARPPGAQIASMLGFAYDVDFYRLWAQLVIQGDFPRPERQFATGTVYLRGQGRGRVRAVHGVDQLQQEIAHLVVDAKLPSFGQQGSSSYEGDGFITVRDRDVGVVEGALDRILATVRVELQESE
jgi:hypothetical protein